MYYGPFPQTTNAYHKDGSGNEYFGEASKGAATHMPRWKIFQIQYTGVNWLVVFPVDSTTGKASDAPKFIWNDVEGYQYRELGC